MFQPSEDLANPLHSLSTLTVDAWPTPIKPHLIRGSVPFSHQTVLLISTTGVLALREGPLGAIDQTLSYARQTSHQCQFFSLSGFTILYLSLQFFFPSLPKSPQKFIETLFAMDVPYVTGSKYWNVNEARHIAWKQFCEITR